jgi:uncharacterized protein
MRWWTHRARITRLVVAIAALALVVAACPADDEDPVDVADPARTFLTLATGSTGGTYFPLGGAMAGVWNDNIDFARVSTQSSGASVENLRLLAAGEVDLIMAVNGVAADAMAGTGAFEDDGPMDLAFLGNVYAEVTQVIARADADINSIADMAGKRIATGPPGSGTEVIARTMLRAEGIDPEADIDAFADTFGDATDGLRDGRIDAVFAILALPHGGLEEVARAVDLTFVDIDDDLLQRLLDDDPTLSALEVEPGTYPGQDDTVTWVTNWATLYALPDLDEDVAYEIVKVMYEQWESIAAAHAVGAQIQLDIALDGRADIPLHPGAERFYDEVGAQ